MARPILDADHFHNEDAAFEYVETQLWPNGPICAKCQSTEIVRVQGRESVLRCKKCQNQFTVMAGTVSTRKRQLYDRRHESAHF